MNENKAYGPLRIVSWVVVATMLGAIGWAGAMSVANWSGIGV